jgi:formylglycine-generating enzyme required for sulfatase activity
MRRRWYTAALALLAACRLSDLSFYQPIDAGDTGSSVGIDAASDVDAGPPPSQFPSCVGLQTTCGTAGDSCCTSLLVPGGTFFRNRDVANNPPISGDTNHPATISSFRLDKYDVTVGRFRAFVAAGMGTQVHPPAANAGAHAQIPGSGWDASWNTSLEATTADLIANLKGSSDSTWRSDQPVNADDEHRPMNYITWYEAMAFCIWDGGYLPTDAEWDYAAQGGNEQRAYPWSSPPGSLTIDSTYASYCPGGGANCTGDGMLGCAVTDIVPVGTFPKGNGKWGHADLAGNLYQWLLDWDNGVYPTSCTDCANLTMPTGSSPARAMRAGAFVYDKDNLRSAGPSNGYPSMRNYIYGFRCARPM